jgi:hypothetical protein
MLEEDFEGEFKTFYQSADPVPVFQFEIYLFGSHLRFRDRKYIYRMEYSQNYRKIKEISPSLAFLTLPMEQK